MKFILIVLMVIALSGCATTKGVSPSASETFKINRAYATGDENKIIEAKMNEVLNFCQPRLSGFEKDSKNQALIAYLLSMSGLIAGSVVAPALVAAAPAANAVWIAAFSGWAGAMNYAGNALKTSGLSGSTLAETRNIIIGNVKRDIVIASDASKTFEERVSALMAARAECVMYEISVPSIPAQ